MTYRLRILQQRYYALLDELHRVVTNYWLAGPYFMVCASMILPAVLLVAHLPLLLVGIVFVLCLALGIAALHYVANLDRLHDPAELILLREAHAQAQIDRRRERARATIIRRHPELASTPVSLIDTLYDIA